MTINEGDEYTPYDIQVCYLDYKFQTCNVSDVIIIINMFIYSIKYLKSYIYFIVFKI